MNLLLCFLLIQMIRSHDALRSEILVCTDVDPDALRFITQNIACASSDNNAVILVSDLLNNLCLLVEQFVTGQSILKRIHGCIHRKSIHRQHIQKTVCRLLIDFLEIIFPDTASSCRKIRNIFIIDLKATPFAKLLGNLLTAAAVLSV